MRDAKGIRNLQSIVQLEYEKGTELMIVVSAMGKTTNALEAVVNALVEGKEQQALEQWIQIIDSHVAIMKELGLQPGVDVRLQGEIPV